MGSTLLLLFFLTCFFEHAVCLPSASVHLPSASVCDSKECKDAANRILDNMDPNEDPCHDFYKFACGRFTEKHPLEEDQQTIQGVEFLIEELNQRKSTLLDDDSLKNHASKIVRKVKEIYDNCLNGKDEKFVTFPYSDDSSYDSSSKYRRNNRKQADRKTECLNHCLMRYRAVGTRLYVDKYFQIEEHKAAREMVNNIRDALFFHAIPGIPWADVKTKQSMLHDLLTMNVNTGYPDWISNDTELDKEYSGDESSKHPAWPLDPFTVDADWSIEEGLSILHGFMFNAKVPPSLNYAAGGFVGTHELGHRFHHWSNEDKGRNKTMQCLLNQVQEIVEPQTRDTYRNASPILYEMVADVGAINATFDAFKKDSRSHQSLPGLSQFTSDQLYFLSQATGWCCTATDDYIRFIMRRDHPFNYYRVVVPAMNSPDFADAFKCKPGSRMNPIKKCSIW